MADFLTIQKNCQIALLQTYFDDLNEEGSIVSPLQPFVDSFARYTFAIYLDHHE